VGVIALLMSLLAPAIRGASPIWRDEAYLLTMVLILIESIFVVVLTAADLRRQRINSFEVIGLVAATFAMFLPVSELIAFIK
jgi:hypothetical protein